MERGGSREEIPYTPKRVRRGAWRAWCRGGVSRETLRSAMRDGVWRCRGRALGRCSGGQGRRAATEFSAWGEGSVAACPARPGARGPGPRGRAPAVVNGALLGRRRRGPRGGSWLAALRSEGPGGGAPGRPFPPRVYGFH